MEPIIKGLFDRIPQPETYWTVEDRAAWLKAAAAAFRILYTSGETSDSDSGIIITVIPLPAQRGGRRRCSPSGSCERSEPPLINPF